MVKVLVVDDREVLLTLLRMLLEDEGYEVHLATDGEAALRVLRDIPGHLIVLLDIRMTPMDGIEFLQTASADNSLWPRIHCAVVSAAVNSATVISHLASTTGTSIPFLAKPFDGDVLLELVETLVATLPPTS